MAEGKQSDGQSDSGEFDRGFEGHSRRQARLGLKLTPAERLRWLEQTMMELRSLEGRARQGCADNPKTDLNRTEG
jgi:hypothetical protein